MLRNPLKKDIFAEVLKPIGQKVGLHAGCFFFRNLQNSINVVNFVEYNCSLRI